ncbi:MAG: hypothetical protein U0R19_08700 [Bryobacteraceae bacterium]
MWHCEDGRWYVGRLTNETLGWYKGYPVEVDEVPARVREAGN